jgi:hypothetical protein
MLARLRVRPSVRCVAACRGSRTVLWSFFLRVLFVLLCVRLAVRDRVPVLLGRPCESYVLWFHAAVWGWGGEDNGWVLEPIRCVVAERPERRSLRCLKRERLLLEVFPSQPPFTTAKMATSMGKVYTVKDVKPEAFVVAFAKHLKQSGKIELPKYVDLIRTGVSKELAPYDPDW